MYHFKKVLNYGDEGQEVKELQEQLIEIKQNKCFIDGKVQELDNNGVFGDVTRSCVENVKAKAFDVISTDYIKTKYLYFNGVNCDESWLQVNDTVNPLFGLLLEHWNEVQNFLDLHIKDADFTPDVPEDVPPATSLQLIEKDIEYATAAIGIKEETGNNDGPEVEEIISIGSGGDIKNGGPPWCQYFQNRNLILACKELGEPYKMTFDGYTPDNVNLGLKKGIGKKGYPGKENIRRGMWGYVYSASRNNACHVYLITGIQGNNVLTIEGNEGNQVKKNKRAISTVWAVVEWAKLYE